MVVLTAARVSAAPEAFAADQERRVWKHLPRYVLGNAPTEYLAGVCSWFLGNSYLVSCSVRKSNALEILQYALTLVFSSLTGICAGVKKISDSFNFL